MGEGLKQEKPAFITLCESEKSRLKVFELGSVRSMEDFDRVCSNF